jgi:choline dehydrogenase-like flavoprotein
VDVIYQGKVHRIGIGTEVVLLLGAIHTPKVLLQSGVGDQADLQRLGIPLVQHLPGVGQNFQDHVGVANVWEIPQRTVDAAFFWFCARYAEPSGDSNEASRRHSSCRNHCPSDRVQAVRSRLNSFA